MNPTSECATVRVGDVAGVRCGDKGNTSILAVHPRPGTDVQWLYEAMNVERLARHFHVPPEKVIVREPTAAGSIIILVQDSLYGGVTRSTTTDPHGKSYAYHLFEMRVPQPGALSKH